MRGPRDSYVGGEWIWYVEIIRPITWALPHLVVSGYKTWGCLRYMVPSSKDWRRQSAYRGKGRLGRGTTLRSGTTHPWGRWFMLGLRQSPICSGPKEDRRLEAWAQTSLRERGKPFDWRTTPRSMYHTYLLNLWIPQTLGGVTWLPSEPLTATS